MSETSKDVLACLGLDCETPRLLSVLNLAHDYSLHALDEVCLRYKVQRWGLRWGLRWAGIDRQRGGYAEVVVAFS